MSYIQQQIQLGAGPPGGDTFSLELQLPPVSQQANGEAKRKLRDGIQAQLRQVDFFLSGDVKIEVEWFVNEQERYETDRSPDVDNIIKPLVDAISGQQGIIFDDNQVQSVSCSWIDNSKREEYICVRIRFRPDEWLPGREYFFVQFTSGLCYPIPTRLNADFQAQLVAVFKRALKARTELDESDVPYHWAKIIMPALRVFHRTRVGDFPVVSLEEFEKRK